MPLRFIATVTVLIAAGVLAGCGSGDRPASAVAGAAAAGDGAPVALAPRRGTGQTVAMAADQDALAKAIERLRITRKKKENGPYEQAGADLNSDGRAKALVLFTGQDWCSPQGCTLVVFEPGEVGFRPISQTIGVKAPIAAGVQLERGLARPDRENRRQQDRAAAIYRRRLPGERGGPGRRQRGCCASRGFDPTSSRRQSDGGGGIGAQRRPSPAIGGLVRGPASNRQRPWTSTILSHAKLPRNRKTSRFSRLRIYAPTPISCGGKSSVPRP